MVPNVPPSSPSDKLLQFQEAVIKKAKLKQILSKYFPPNEVQGILAVTCSFCLSKGDYSLLDKALKDLSVTDEFREARDYLNK